MTVKRLIVLLIAFSVEVLAEPQELFWEDLVPDDFVLDESPVNHDGSMVQQNLNAPVVTLLNGKDVKIPGFVVPLEGDERLTTEFLLVPYFGACIHVPPPPPNQIIHVKFPEGVPIDNLYDAIWVTGTLSTEGWKGDVATVGYSLAGQKIAPFEG